MHGAKPGWLKLTRVLSVFLCVICEQLLALSFQTTTATTGDLHPGNVFVSHDGKKFILFDVGIAAEYSESDHRNIVEILGAFIRKQGRKAGRLMIDNSNNSYMPWKLD